MRAVFQGDYISTLYTSYHPYLDISTLYHPYLDIIPPIMSRYASLSAVWSSFVIFPIAEKLENKLVAKIRSWKFGRRNSWPIRRRESGVKIIWKSGTFGSVPTKDMQTPPPQFWSQFHERCAMCWNEWKTITYLIFPIFIFRNIVKNSSKNDNL